MSSAAERAAHVRARPVAHPADMIEYARLLKAGVRGRLHEAVLHRSAVFQPPTSTTAKR
ncbi:hypothetical protein ACIBJF_47305 [Streptomyces sp. NPDC050743]|uniref:hypothetical protein n=1 Tax=Streptomyces sp. NPDC050743 TaxID=3365634 RepID=UPI0037ABD1EF